MKILFTGFSARECGDTKREALRWDMNKPVLEAAAAVGEVDRRRVQLGETLDHDLIIMCLNQTLSFNTRHGVLGSLWAARSGIPVLMFVNDWQHRSWISHLNTVQRDPEKYLMKRVGGERLFHMEDDETTRQHMDALIEGASLITNPWPERFKAIVPTFSWGDHSQFSQTLPMTQEQYACVDFSPFGVASVDCPAPPAPADRIHHTWLLPSLSPQDKWVDKQQLAWPVDYLGSRKLKAERVSEQEVLNRVNRYAGTLSPRYTYLMGSGWWRIRYNYTAMTGGLIAGDPAEAGCLGPAFQHSPAELEQLSDQDRADVAADQRQLMESSYWPLDQAQQYMIDVVRWAAG